jgi:hypothetical protein
MKGSLHVGFDYLLVTRDNFENLATMLNRKRGYVLIAHHTHFPSLPFFIDMFESPAIDISKRKLCASNSRRRPPGRHYRVSATPTAQSFMSQFEGLPVGSDFVFTITPQSIITRGFLANGDTTLFIKNPASFADALAFVLRDTVAKEASFAEEQIREMADYAANDLETNAVLQRNTDAGVKADRLMCG